MSARARSARLPRRVEPRLVGVEEKIVPERALRTFSRLPDKVVFPTPPAQLPLLSPFLAVLAQKKIMRYKRHKIQHT